MSEMKVRSTFIGHIQYINKGEYELINYLAKYLIETVIKAVERKCSILLEIIIGGLSKSRWWIRKHAG